MQRWCSMVAKSWFRSLVVVLVLVGLVYAAGERINGDRTIDGSLNYAADAGNNDTYAITLSPAAAGYVTGARYSFKANTLNTGAASLNVNSLGAKTIKKWLGTSKSDLITGD